MMPNLDITKLNLIAVFILHRTWWSDLLVYWGFDRFKYKRIDINHLTTTPYFHQLPCGTCLIGFPDYNLTIEYNTYTGLVRGRRYYENEIDRGMVPAMFQINLGQALTLEPMELYREYRWMN